MRARPFIQAGESPRPYSEIRAERGDDTGRDRVLADIARLEAEAREAPSDIERDRIRCEAEELRCALYHAAAKR